MNNFRLAGRVERYHTEPTIQRQDIASHTWQVLRIWMELYGAPSPEVTTYIMTHDVGEHHTGDLPHMVKRDHPELKALLDKLEGAHLDKIFIECLPEYGVLATPTDWDLLRIKLCDLLETAEFSLDEYKLGNKTAVQILSNIQKAITKKIEEHEEHDIDHPDILAAITRLGEIAFSFNKFSR